MNSTLLKPLNDDKGNRTYKVTFNLSEAATVYVAHDKRMSKKPLWLSVFKRTGERIEVDRPRKSDRTFDVFSKKFQPGVVVLGPNLDPKSSDANVSMYFVLVKPDK